jgi:hypothetical protein
MTVEPSAAVTEFRAAAEHFRTTMEETTASLPGQWSARRLRNAVARVYLAAALLPRVDAGDSDLEPRRAPTASALEAALRQRLGAADTFTDVWDPTEPDSSDPIARTLSGELVEIYDDLGEALVLLDEAAAGRPDLLWDVWFAFETHWGKHAIDVLRPLHHLALR